MYLTTLNINENKVLINLDRVDSIVQEDDTIMFKFAYRTEIIEYSEESWNTIVNVLQKAEKDKKVTLPKPLDVKVVNK